MKQTLQFFGVRHFVKSESTKRPKLWYNFFAKTIEKTLPQIAIYATLISIWVFYREGGNEDGK